MEKLVDCSIGLESGCKAKCCKLNVILDSGDLKKGIVETQKSRAGIIIVAKGEDGYCTYLDRETFKCKIYENRPFECRDYSCINDKRIDEEVRRALKVKHLLIHFSSLFYAKPVRPLWKDVRRRSTRTSRRM